MISWIKLLCGHLFLLKIITNIKILKLKKMWYLKITLISGVLQMIPNPQKISGVLQMMTYVNKWTPPPPKKNEWSAADDHAPTKISGVPQMTTLSLKCGVLQLIKICIYKTWIKTAVKYFLIGLSYLYLLLISHIFNNMLWWKQVKATALALSNMVWLNESMTGHESRGQISTCCLVLMWI